MKHFFIKIPKNQAMAFTLFSIANEIRIILSWLEKSSDFFSFSDDEYISATCVMAAEKEDDFKKSEWSKFVKP